MGLVGSKMVNRVIMGNTLLLGRILTHHVLSSTHKSDEVWPCKEVRQKRIIPELRKVLMPGQRNSFRGVTPDTKGDHPASDRQKPSSWGRQRNTRREERRRTVCRVSQVTWVTTTSSGPVDYSHDGRKRGPFDEKRGNPIIRKAPFLNNLINLFRKE